MNIMPGEFRNPGAEEFVRQEQSREAEPRPERAQLFREHVEIFQGWDGIEVGVDAHGKVVEVLADVGVGYGGWSEDEIKRVFFPEEVKGKDWKDVRVTADGMNRALREGKVTISPDSAGSRSYEIEAVENGGSTVEKDGDAPEYYYSQSDSVDSGFGQDTYETLQEEGGIYVESVEVFKGWDTVKVELDADGKVLEFHSDVNIGYGGWSEDEIKRVFFPEEVKGKDWKDVRVTADGMNRALREGRIKMVSDKRNAHAYEIEVVSE
jgi:hypothetical protein